MHIHYNDLYRNPITQRCFVLCLDEIGPEVLKKKILNFVNVFSLFCNYLQLEKGVALHLKKNLNPHHPKTLCALFG